MHCITLDEAVAHNFTISPNSQTSYLGDGDTIIKACGEIKTILYRDKTRLTFEAMVCRRLHSPAIGGTLFIKENGIKQDFINNTISLLNDRSTVPATTKEATFPVKIHQPNHGDKPPLVTLKTKQILLPGDTISVQTNIPDPLVHTDAWMSSRWPPPQLSHIQNGLLQLTNKSSSPILLQENKSNPVEITTIINLD